jgi:hypothetical protein
VIASTTSVETGGTTRTKLRTQRTTNRRNMTPRNKPTYFGQGLFLSCCSRGFCRGKHTPATHPGIRHVKIAGSEKIGDRSWDLHVQPHTPSSLGGRGWSQTSSLVRS